MKFLEGKKAFEAVIRAISDTKEKIDVFMFIWRNDNIGNKLLNELLKAADRGVKVRITKDYAGAVFEFSEEYRDSMFHKPNFQTRFRIWLFDRVHKGLAGDRRVRSNNLRRFLRHPSVSYNSKYYFDHSKVWVFDNKRMIMGSMNVDDRESGVDIRGIKWRDCMVETKNKSLIKEFYSKRSGSLPFKLRNPSIISRTKYNSEILPSIIELLKSAKKSVEIHMAYWGHPLINNEIINCGKRGVDITLVLPKKSNILHNRNMATMSRIFRSTNAKIYLCDYMIHAKLMVIDSSRVFLGSANFNRVGILFSKETNIYFKMNSSFYKDIRRFLDHNIKRSTHVKSIKSLSYNPLKALVEL